jgi:hypothetical protein
LRQQLKVDHEAGKSPLDEIDPAHRRKLQGLFSRLTGGRDATPAERKMLEETISGLLETGMADSAEGSESE